MFILIIFDLFGSVGHFGQRKDAKLTPAEREQVLCPIPCRVQGAVGRCKAERIREFQRRRQSGAASAVPQELWTWDEWFLFST